MAVRKFEDLEVWKEGIRLWISTRFGRVRDFALRDQIPKPASVLSNIADGFERNSNKEFIQFLFISKGSCAELSTQLYIAGEVEVLEKAVCKDFVDRSTSISRMLYGLIKTRKEKFK